MSKKYRNIISLDENYKLNETQLKTLIETNTYIIGHIWPEEDFNEFVKEGENFHVSGTEILYNFYDYHLNPEIVDEILIQIYHTLQKRKIRYILPKEKIKFELGQYINYKDKLNYLNKKHAEIWNSSEYLKCSRSKSEFLRFNEMSDEEYLKSDDWLDCIWDESENHNILRYLSTNDGIYYCFKELIDKREEYGRIKALSLYCKELLPIKDKSALNTTTKGINNLTPMQQVCFVEILRDRIHSFKNLDYNEKIGYLRIIVPQIKDEINEKLSVLEDLIDMSTTDWDILVAVSSNYANELIKLSNSSFTNLSKSISNYYRGKVKKADGEKFNDKEISNNNKFDKAQPLILDAENFIKACLNNNGTTSGIPD